MQAILSRLGVVLPQTRALLRVLFIMLVVVGLVVSLLPMDGVVNLENNKDKVAHALSFLGFAALLDLATTRSFWRWKFPVLLGYGALIEILQAFTPWRSFWFWDFTADTTGVLLYWLLWRLVLSRFIRHA